MPQTRFTAGFGRAPGNVRPGSTASWAKKSMGNAKQDMAQIIRRYESLIKNLEGVTPTVLYNALLPVFNRSQVYVPKKTGALMDSGRLDVFPAGPGGKTTASITYGGKDAPYAAIVHEGTWMNHAAPTRSKFLQAALEEELDAVMSSLIVDYSIALGLR